MHALAEGQAAGYTPSVHDIAHRTALDLAAAIRRREIGSRELLEHLLARVECLNPKLNAVVTLEADRALARGEVRGPLHGLPMTIKDTFETAEIRTTAGAPAFSSHVPSRDATAVARLVGAGAIVFGKTNVPLFAGDLQSYNAIFGTTNNPWDAARSPGGSSGAAALAAGLTTLELGSDLGGSIRNPAHYCGVYGHKPTYGVIPMRGHIPGPPGTLDADLGRGTAGSRRRRSRDGARGARGTRRSPCRYLEARAATTPRRRHCDYRVVAWLDDPEAAIAGELREVFESVADRLRRAGFRVDDRVRPVADLREVQRSTRQLMWPIVAGGLSDEQFAGYVHARRERGPRRLEPRRTVRARRDAPPSRLAAARRMARAIALDGRSSSATSTSCFARSCRPRHLPHDHGEPAAARIVVNGDRAPPGTS
jgi:amidase